MFEVDSGEQQPIHQQKNDEIEPPQGKNITAERFDDLIEENDIHWMKNIIKEYGFERHPKEFKWTKQPTFKGSLGKKCFEKAALKAQDFFLRISKKAKEKSPWKRLQETTKDNLLKVTAARYLLVTYILWFVSAKKLTACEETRDSYTDIPQSWKIPEGGVCFPKPYGSATYKSDYDVGLIGKDAGTVTTKFNDYFKEKFDQPSELVFDTNVYAYTLEFAMPAMFTGLPHLFDFSLNYLERVMWYKMQELASAYYKVFKYDENFFNKMKSGAIETIGDEVALKMLKHWLKTFQDMNEEIKLRKEGHKTLADFRHGHNQKYQYYLQSMSTRGGYTIRSTDNLAKALLYAAEAYHTRGAIRHVVQGIQMNAISTCQYYTPLSTYDLWVSMIENWGEAIKEYQHCGKEISTAKCLMKMSKYLSRMFHAMRVIQRARLPKEARIGLLDFGTIGDPEYVTNLLLQYKRSGKELSRVAYEFVELFLRRFKCKDDVKPPPKNFPRECLEKIQAKVNEYNIILASKVNKIETLTAQLSL
ncbi:hypothetical protein AWC38_SpisGene23331 [Stylophora pistillata]|uniref:Uncharacterized protein n=1 Tax=Stylophora pistillata TaxID=50429 RepID=A0A2B4R4W2_STYPI|nr:hypothetical protein AWC38_SpisGene23331 [Stylophora pistillata]